MVVIIRSSKLTAKTGAHQYEVNSRKRSMAILEDMISLRLASPFRSKTLHKSIGSAPAIIKSATPSFPVYEETFSEIGEWTAL